MPLDNFEIFELHETGPRQIADRFPRRIRNQIKRKVLHIDLAISPGVRPFYWDSYSKWAQRIENILVARLFGIGDNSSRLGITLPIVRSCAIPPSLPYDLSGMYRRV